MKVDGRLKRLLVTVLLIIGGIYLCNMLYIMIDQLMNGFVVDWFEDNYVEEKQLFTKDGLTYYTKAIRWGKVKELLLKILIGLVIFWIVIALMVQMVSIVNFTRTLAVGNLRYGRAEEKTI